MADDSDALPISDWAESFCDISELKAYIEEEYPAAYKYLPSTISHRIEIQDEPDARSKHVSVLIGQLAGPQDPNSLDENNAFAFVSTKTGDFGFRTADGEMLEIEDIELSEPFCWFPMRQKHAFTYYASPLDLEAYVRYYVALHGHSGHFGKFPNSTGVRTKLAYHLDSAGLTIANARRESELDQDSASSPTIPTPGMRIIIKCGYSAEAVTGTSRTASDGLDEVPTQPTSLAMAPVTVLKDTIPVTSTLKKHCKAKARRVKGRDPGRLPTTKDMIHDLKSQLKNSRDEVEDLRSELEGAKNTADEAAMWKEKYEKLRRVMFGALEETR
ncbi:hypothetical protein NX059_000816 [Plenodomus lindquistii]|nr:hypothetical protein NX059_000816 [Plenodomus lindquistii]